jgi:large subunit ribosomal protein L10
MSNEQRFVEKGKTVDALRASFASAPLVVLADFKGTKVKDLDRFRRNVEKGGLKMQVVKNTLCWRAVQGTEKEKLADHFRGNIAVLFADENPIAAARALRDQLKENEKFTVRAGYFDGDVLDAKGIAAVAELPGREELLSKLLTTIQAGPQQLLGVLQGAPRDLVYLLNNHSQNIKE